MGGAEGMTLVDWGDTLMHGLPWVALMIVGLTDLIKKTSR
jgi:hypothetical protein